MRRTAILALAVGLVMSLAAPAFAGTENRADNGPNPRGVVYVTSQGQYYDVIALGDLPMTGRFQKLENGTTEFGPGDAGYLGGRWWVDVNGNDIQDEGDHFFLCPLLGPGRDAP